MTKTAIQSSRAPQAIGPYSQAVRAGSWVFVSGQIGLGPQGALADGGIEGQTETALRNLGAVLEAAGLGYDAVVKTTVYLKDMAQFAEMNAVYERHFKDPFPARATVEAAALPKGALVEIEAVAVGGPAK